MKHLLVLALATLLGSTAVSAQQVGDSAPKVRSLLGGPHFLRESTEGELWLYLAGTRLRLSEGFVTGIDRGPVIVPAAASSANAAWSGTSTQPAAATARAEPPTAWASVTHEWRSFFGTTTAPERELKTFWTKEERALNLVGGMLLLGGIAILLLCHIVIVERAFEESYMWGLGSLFLPPVALIFALRQWHNVWKPFVTQVGVILSLLLSGLILQS